MFLIITIGLCFITTLALYIIIDTQCGENGIIQKEKRAKLVLSKYRDKIDQERKMISRILHDSVNQKVIVTKLLLEKISDDEGDHRETIKELLKINNEIYSECRSIINTARIETLESLGLIDAIQELIDTYKKLGRDIKFYFYHIDLSSLSHKVSTNVYYIISEALLNIIKHSQANEVYIEFKKLRKGRFSLYIRDDGIGFSNIDYGIGLTDIEERANDIKGRMKITSAIEKGVRITLYFPSST